MAIKITGYGIFTSTGGNKCIQCQTRMRKDMPYMSPVTGKRVIRELKGKSLCVSCMLELAGNITTKIRNDERGVDLYEKRRFIEHLDKD